MQIAIDSYCYHRYFGEVYPGLESPPNRAMTLDEVIDRAIAFGVEGVSLESFMLDDTSPVRLVALRKKLDEAGLARVWAWGHPDGLGSGSRPEAIKDLFANIDVACALGAGVMRICAGGRRTRPVNWVDHRRNLLPLLKHAAERAEARGVVLAVENHVDLLAGELAELIEAVDSPALGVCLDTANNLRMLEDPMVAIETLAPYARATHLKDITAYRGDPKTFGFWPSVPLGQGLIDIPATLRLLKQYDYQGLLALEIDYLHPDHGDEASAIAASLDTLRRTLAKL
ncbi:sugar phosphate isomerase/epimerase family protein [Halomonas urumqiensis]|uniref:Sugar phosphate isomerase/epimerase n=1 Tax=Halomonas urumqiensis TaxID=1684789 RepID=A0A2N7UJ35_9GAMM|nr:sugar phosphate isomerase/epimerase family protein [Halomonas urumqiensis]PMR80453.1 sugar phosphate isomerase/epimerase [Halomonas urumqiensis]PTB01702.1 sugar phosphate isomerase/epimerase [Halomonas urumqiensis]GHE22205.1 hypothetical protein GCM10017767_27260 [Halomonas urumqiensis]